MVSTVHPEAAKRSIFDVPRKPDPLEVVIAAEALKHRYRALISILRRGELEGRGLPATTGHSDPVPRSIWSREEFHLDASTGDVVQDNPESTGRYDRLIRRWIGVMLQRPNLANPSVHDIGAVFHGKPLAHDDLLSPAPGPQVASIRQSKAIARVETKVTSRSACKSWLMKMMAESKDQRGVNHSAKKGKILNDEIADWAPAWRLLGSHRRPPNWTRRSLVTVSDRGRLLRSPLRQSVE